jgi:hypothetical protein
MAEYPKRNGLRQTPLKRKTALVTFIARDGIRVTTTVKRGTKPMKRTLLKPISDKKLAQNCGKAVVSLKRSRIKPVSDKRAIENAEYGKLIAKLIGGVYTFGAKYTFTSELRGGNGELIGSDYIHPHHIDHRENVRLLNPFNIICITPSQHRYETAHHTFQREQELKDIVRPLRISQGFVPSDYGEELPQ